MLLLFLFVYFVGHVVSLNQPNIIIMLLDDVSFCFFQFHHMWRSIGKGVLFKTFDVNVQVHSVPELWRQMFWSTPFPIERHILWRSIGKEVLFKIMERHFFKMLLSKLVVRFVIICSKNCFKMLFSYLWWSTGKRHVSRRRRQNSGTNVPEFWRQRLETCLFPMDHHIWGTFNFS